MPNKIKYLKRNICEEKEYHFGILFLIAKNDELNKILRKNIDK